MIKIKRIKKFLFIIFLLFMVLALSSLISGCSKNKDAAKAVSTSENQVSKTTSTQTAQSQNTNNTSSTKEADPDKKHFGDLYEGLHITGTPIEVNINSYRLKISGAIDKELSLTFDDVKNMKSVREEIELICPGIAPGENTFVDKGFWTGVKVIDLLNLAVPKKEAKNVEFISIDGSYTKILTIEEVKKDGFLIAYQFNDKEFSKYHGYPLRLVAKNKAGSYWVKWLGQINVLVN